MSDWRQEIDAIDAELLRLLNQRAAIACEIAIIKVASGLPAYDGNREQQVLDRIAARNTGPLDEEGVTGIFRSIIRQIRRLGTERMLELKPARSKDGSGTAEVVP
ncbi:MAG TPA: chorismate mutase [Candidatus Angelobacter sp.]|nr:chorismate mutase [Candidatus Angelobacter sp.]